MVQKVVTAAIPATGAGATSARTVIATPDDSGARTVVGVKASLTTKGMKLHLDNNSQDAVVVDCATLGQLTWPLQVNYVVASTVQISFSLENTTGGALVAGDFVSIIYQA